MDIVREHFEHEAAEFDRIIVRLIPNYSEMVEALVAVLPFPRDAAIQVTDLGCGTGTVAMRVLQAFPNAEVTCVDLAENMIAIAKTKLAPCGRARFFAGDFNEFDFNSKYDAVVSSLALHHLPTDQDKQSFYLKILDSLKPGGAFYNADVVLGSNEILQSYYMRQWRAFMSREVAEAEIDGTWIPKYHAEDRPAKLMDQLEWLTKIGFSGVDVIWKCYNFAVYGGVKLSLG